MKKQKVLVTTQDGQACDEFTTFVVHPPTTLTVNSVTDALRNSGITPSDIRTEVAVDLPDGNPHLAVAVLVALMGYLRAVPETVTLAGQPRKLSPIDKAFRRMFGNEPITPDGDLQIGEPSQQTRFLGTSQPWSRDDYLAIRNATNLLWVPHPSTDKSLAQLVLLTAVRSDTPKERFPIMLTGENSLDLNALRKTCSELRATHTDDDRTTIVQPIAPSPRAQYLQRAAHVDALPVLHKLLASEHESGLICPRSTQHKRPAEPLLVDGNLVECSVCDPYPVDILRVVMDTTRMVADDAAAWILGEAKQHYV